MKKSIAILFVMCLVFSMTGCVSQSELDAVITERDALQAELDTLQLKVDQYSEIINAMDSEEYEIAMGIISDKKIAKETAELGDFYANTVTVELSAENIAEYLEFLPYEIEYLDAFGNGTGRYDCGISLSSKVFDSGLVYWSSEDIAIEILFPENYTYQTVGNWSVYSAGSQPWGWENGSTVVKEPLGAVVYGFSNDKVSEMPNFYPELLSFGNVKGTITFVKADYVESVSNEGGRTVFLKDGQAQLIGYWCNGVDWPENILG